MSPTRSVMRSTCLRMRAWACGALFGAGAGQVHHLRRQADDAQRILEVMHNGLRKPADDRQTFGLDQFLDMQLVEFAQPMADLLQQGEGQSGRPLDERQQFAARQEKHLRRLRRRGRGGARTMFDHRHLPENFARPKPRKTRRPFLPAEISTRPDLTK